MGDDDDGWDWFLFLLGAYLVVSIAATLWGWPRNPDGSWR